MSLMVHLLTVGRSLKSAKDKPSPFRMKQPILLPKFGPKAGTESAQCDDLNQASREGEAGEDEVAAENKAAVLRDLPSILKAIRVRRGRMVQTELSLEGVQVIRNDLREIGSSQVSGSNPFRSSQTITVAGHWWRRLNERLFARARK
jgi:hypothetical protein